MGGSIMNRMRGFLLILMSLSALSYVGQARASVPDTTCHLQRQVRIDPETLAATMSTPTETYRFTNGKLHISSPDRPEYTYDSVTEVEFRRRYTSRDKIFIFTNQSLLPGTVRMLAFHSDLYDIRVSEFACTR
jgi:hypothetical protein